MTTQAHSEKLISDYQRRLEKLEEQKAQLGIYTPPHILTEIEDIGVKLKELGITTAQQKLGEMPLDWIPEVAPLPLGSRMPLIPNPLFVGRQKDLIALAKALHVGKTAVIGQIAAATGLGGIGKTQLASAFAHRYGQFFYGGVFWLSFADPVSIPTEVASCGGRPFLNLTMGFNELELGMQVQLVQAAWAEAIPRLLVFDNCEDEELLAKWRPRTGGSRVLVTSRRGEWDPGLGITSLRLGVLSRTESIELLRKFQPNLRDMEAEAIAEELGDLPLALHLAGSYLKRYGGVVTVGEYVAQLRDRTLLEHPSLKGRGTTLSPTAHELHVGRSFSLSYDRLKPDETSVDVLAQALLTRASCLASGEPIPHILLIATLNLVEDEPEEYLQAEDALTRLIELGLLEVEAEGTLILHRLVAVFVETMALGINEGRTAVEETLLAEAKRLNDGGYPGPLVTWQPHLRVVTEVAQERFDELGAQLGNELGRHLRQIGDYEAARPYLERSLSIREKILGCNHQKTAESLNNLAKLLQAQGDYVSAKSYFVRALDLRKRVLGSDHPETAKSLNNLASLLHDQGDYEAARPYLEQSLTIQEKMLGFDHPDTALSLNNMGLLLHVIGDFQAAHQNYEQALTIREKVLGLDHPETATSLNNLAMLLQDQGEYQAAQSHYLRALAIHEHVYGTEHMATAACLNNLASLHQDQGDYEAARLYYERALQIAEKVLGPNHPNTATSVSNLGTLLKIQGEFQAAQPFLERAVVIFEKIFGPDHPDTALSLNNLASLLHIQGDLEVAKSYYQRALVIFQKTLGADHHYTCIVYRNLVKLYESEEDKEKDDYL